MNHIERLEQQQSDERERVARRDAILRLADNPDFRKVIIEDFSTKECARYVRESVSPALGEKERADALAMAQAAGYLKQFLNVNIQMGDTAENTIRDIDEALAEARAEEGGDD
jgi:predicted methyltransferase MtxX (methanogen marker protein 4)